jgi:hypothetical protein
MLITQTTQTEPHALRPEQLNTEPLCPGVRTRTQADLCDTDHMWREYKESEHGIITSKQFSVQDGELKSAGNRKH